VFEIRIFRRSVGNFRLGMLFKHSRISISDVWCRKGRFAFVSLFCFSYIGEMLNGMVIVVDNDDISGSL
jgi:hypothetical protein